MKENEGQVLFAVDMTHDRYRRDREKQLCSELIEGYRTYKLLSALRQILRYIVKQWEQTHPTVDVATLCELLAENNFDWLLSTNQRENMIALLDFLDAQLVALTEEQATEEITPDDLQSIFQRSLLMLQLESEPDGMLTAEVANDLLYARLKSIRRRFPSRSQRQRFYRLGFSLSDCERVEASSDKLLEMFLTAKDYYRWSFEVRYHFLSHALSFLLELGELNPDASSLPKNIKENWRQMWKPILNLWLQGDTPNEMIEKVEVAEVTTSPAEVSVLIDDLYGYRAPWGLNALTAYLHEVAAESGQELPRVTNCLSALLKYGVHSPAAASLLAFGLESRKLALKMVELCPDEMMEPRDLLMWFVGLTKEAMTSIGFTRGEIEVINSAQREARSLTHTEPRRQPAWTISIIRPDNAQGELREGDSLTLRPLHDIEGRAFGLYTLWGDPIGSFEWPGEVPVVWSLPELVEVSVAKKETLPQGDGDILTLNIEEV